MLNTVNFMRNDKLEKIRNKIIIKEQNNLNTEKECIEFLSEVGSVKNLDTSDIKLVKFDEPISEIPIVACKQIAKYYFKQFEVTKVSIEKYLQNQSSNTLDLCFANAALLNCISLEFYDVLLRFGNWEKGYFYDDLPGNCLEFKETFPDNLKQLIVLYHTLHLKVEDMLQEQSKSKAMSIAFLVVSFSEELKLIIENAKTLL